MPNYTTFNKSQVNAMLEPMFLGQHVNVSRYDQQKHPIFEKLIEKQLSFFWRPEEVDLSRDRKDFMGLSEAEKHIFISNLKYQTLLDSVAARSVNMLFLPIVSIPELETWIETHAFAETIHSRSYTHIIRNIFTDPSKIFDDIPINPAIKRRAESVVDVFDKLIEMNGLYSLLGLGVHVINGKTIDLTLKSYKKQILLAIAALNALEGLRFYVSFACSFAFAERSLMEGNAKIIKLIARDESLHLTGTQHMLNIFRSGRDDPGFAEIWDECSNEIRAIMVDAGKQEEEWADELFVHGSMIGLNASILKDIVRYYVDTRLIAIGLAPEYGIVSHPAPWMNSHIVSDNVQVAPQEAEISSYLVGQVDNDMEDEDFDGFDDL